MAYGDGDFRSGIQSLSTNERTLLDLIWRLGPISRKALADIGGVTGASATRLTKRALDLGLIEESIDRTGSVGNPQRPLRRSQSGIYSIGVSFTKSSIGCALTDIEGDVLNLEHSEADQISIDSIAEAVERFSSKRPELKSPDAKVLGVGVAVPGYRSRTDGQWAIHWDFPELQRIDIEGTLEDRLGLPVTAERDAVAAAWAERLIGAGKKMSTFCLMYLAQGVGGAVMNNGHPVLGANGNAAGLGVLFPYEEGPRPSAHSLAEHLERSGVPLSNFDPGSIAHNNALDGWIELIIPSLRDGLDMIARLYDPEAIILGGSIPRFVLDRMVVATDYAGIQNNYTAELPAPRIAVSNLNDHCLYQGAASLPVARLLSSSG